MSREAKTGITASLTDWVLHHKLVVSVVWIAATAAAFPFLPSATGALSAGFSLPGKPGYDANRDIQRTFGAGGGDSPAPIVAVVTVPRGKSVKDATVASELAAVDGRIHAAIPKARIASYPGTRNDDLVSKDGRTAFALIYAPLVPSFNPTAAPLRALENALAGATVGGSTVHLTGMEVLDQAEDEGNGPSVLVEVLLGGLGAIFVLIFVFSSALVIVPLLMAIVSIPLTFMLVWALTTVTEVSMIVEFLVALIGLGLAIDYGLVIVMRWREEMDAGRNATEAVRIAMATAGRAVVFSGTTVAIGLLALIVLPVPFLRSMGIGGLLIPLVSVAAALTLLPALLGSVGPALDRRRLRRGDRPTRVWRAWGRLIVRHRWVATIAALAVLGAMLAPAASTSVRTPDADSLAHGGPAETGLRQLQESGIGEGVLTPFEVIATGGRPDALAEAIEKVDGIAGVAAPGDWHRGGTYVVDAWTASAGHLQEAADTYDRMVADVRSLPGQPQVGGAVPLSLDFVDAVFGSFPLMVALISIVTFLLLARAFRSLLLPLKAIVFNLISVGAVWGFLVAFWQWGWGSEAIFGIPPTGALTTFIPLMVFAFLYGLSMDYEVFILARVREEYDATGSTREAVVNGIGSTGRLVTSGALILFLAFLALASGPSTHVKMFATGLAVGIILDATVVRALLLPAMITLFGKWNWWMPNWAARALRVAPARGSQ